MLQLPDLTAELSGNGLLQSAAGAELSLGVRLSVDDWEPRISIVGCSWKLQLLDPKIELPGNGLLQSAAGTVLSLPSGFLKRVHPKDSNLGVSY